MKKAMWILTCMLLFACPAASQTVTMTFVGDCTLGASVDWPADDERIFPNVVAREGIHLDQSYGVVNCAVTYPTNSKPHIGKPKTERSERIILLTSTMRALLVQVEQKEGFVCGGEQPWCYSRAMRTYRSAFKHLGIIGHCAYDFRTTFATQLKESGMDSSAIADLMGHADTRMVETVYARRRKEGVMKHLAALEERNA